MRLVLFCFAVCALSHISVGQRPQRPRLRGRNFRPAPRQSSTPVRHLECVDYGAFRDQSWICMNKADCPQHYDAAAVNAEIESSSVSGCYGSDVDECVTKANRTFLRKKDENADRTIELEELCQLKEIPITNVLVEKPSFQQREVCVIVDTSWLHQTFYFAKCTNPRNTSHDKCQLDYASRNEYRCVQSGFVWRTLWVYCPRIRSFHTIDRLVPTTCSCRKCAHCESMRRLLDDFMRDHRRNMGGNAPDIRNPSQFKPKPERCIL